MATTPLQQLAVWEPYPGPVAQESTFVAHGHVGALIAKQLIIGAHLIDVFSNDNERSTAYTEGHHRRPPARPVAGCSNVEKPIIKVYGADAKLLGGVLGDGYLGYSHLNVKNALPLADAIEVLHSFGGWQLSDNYFNAPGATSSPVEGQVDTVLFQYSFSWGQLFHYPKAFWGQGPDLITTVFGMFNHVTSPLNTTSHDPEQAEVRRRADVPPARLDGHRLPRRRRAAEHGQRGPGVLRCSRRA